MLNKLVLLAFLALAAALPAHAQRRRTPLKPAKNATVQTKRAVISDAEWNALADALRLEDWSKAADLTARQIAVLSTENDKKQLAQLRYLRLFALAGVVLGFSEKGNLAEAEKVLLELERLTFSLIGKEFVLPPRTFAADCAGKLNFICKVNDTPTALRTTATNKSGNAIHSFDYIRCDSPVQEFVTDGSKIFLGGVLERADHNDDPAKPWALRLFFKKGFVFEVRPVSVTP